MKPHSNIAAYFGFIPSNELGNYVYVMTEFVHGKTLYAIIRDGDEGRLDEQVAAKVLVSCGFLLDKKYC
jgi:hypothetical protein